MVDFLYVMEDTVNSATTDSCYTFIPFDKNTTQKMATLKNKTNHNEILTDEECIVYHKDKKTSDIEENDMGRNATNCVACKTLLKTINKFYGNN
ncbi:hypothetical protein EBU24_02675 [bacterium]|nr:hypothetical protein [bacterium]